MAFMGYVIRRWLLNAMPDKLSSRLLCEPRDRDQLRNLSPIYSS